MVERPWVSEALKLKWQDPEYREKFHKATSRSRGKQPKMSEASKKRWEDPEYRIRMEAHLKEARDHSQKEWTDEMKESMRQITLSRNYRHSTEIRLQLSEKRKGIEYTDAEIIRQMESHGREIWYGGVRYYLREPRTLTPEDPARLLSYLFAWDSTLLNKQALRERMKQKRGPNNPRWKGGITKLNHAIRDCQKELEWRQRVFERDNFTCQQTGQRGGKLHAHHIVQIKDLIEKFGIRTLEEAYSCEAFWDVSNGVTMTEQAHKDWHKENGK